MFYRLRPPAELMWLDLAGISDSLVAGQNLDLDRLADDWKPAEELPFSEDLLRIALRHGHRTATGLAVRATHTTDLGRADELRRLTDQSEALHADLRDSPTGQMMERLISGWSAHGEELNQRVREDMEHSAVEAEEDLAETLGTPVRPELAEHWTSLGGRLPTGDKQHE